MKKNLAFLVIFLLLTIILFSCSPTGSKEIKTYFTYLPLETKYIEYYDITELSKNKNYSLFLDEKLSTNNVFKVSGLQKPSEANEFLFANLIDDSEIIILSFSYNLERMKERLINLDYNLRKYNDNEYFVSFNKFVILKENFIVFSRFLGSEKIIDCQKNKEISFGKATQYKKIKSAIDYDYDYFRLEIKDRINQIASYKIDENIHFKYIFQDKLNEKPPFENVLNNIKSFIKKTPNYLEVIFGTNKFNELVKNYYEYLANEKNYKVNNDLLIIEMEIEKTLLEFDNKQYFKMKDSFFKYFTEF